MTYQVKEIFYSLQGEGANTGRSAVFCRFAGCNLWSGREPDRPTATCRFCDTDFVGTDGPGGGTFTTARELAASILSAWPASQSQLEINAPTPKSLSTQIPSTARPLVVFTGGEPILQLDPAAIQAMHQHGFEVAVETNGTLPLPPDIDWVCVSPKASTQLVVTTGQELKLVYPQTGCRPTDFEHLDFNYFWLQPMDGPHLDQHTQAAARYCLNHPRWRLSLQTHKLLGLR